MAHIDNGLSVDVYTAATESEDRSTDSIKEDRRALEAFVVENAEFETLEGLLEQFNIFEAIGVVRQELRHSDFLAFLLDPKQNHRLGDAFVQRLLQKILISAAQHAQPISPVHLDSWDLGRLTVRREWQNIDILLVDQQNRLVVVVENKVASTEHSGQLEKYLRLISTEYPAPEWRHLPIYLTPDGEEPSDPRYLPADYGLVADAVEAMAESRQATLDSGVYSLMVHYVEMLRRHIVAGSEIADLCRMIYQRHQRALDLIFEHRPDRQAEIQSILVELISSRDDLILDTESKHVVRFGHSDWEQLPKGYGWTRSGRIMLFEWHNYSELLDLNLYVGPGPIEVREHLINTAIALQPPYRVSKRKLTETQKWRSVFSRRFLMPEDYEESTIGEVNQRIRAKWDEFVNRDLPALVAPIRNSFGSSAVQPAVGQVQRTT